MEKREIQVITAGKMKAEELKQVISGKTFLGDIQGYGGEESGMSADAERFGISLAESDAIAHVVFQAKIRQADLVVVRWSRHEVYSLKTSIIAGYALGSAYQNPALPEPQSTINQ